MAFLESSPILMVILLVALGIISVGASLWRIAQGDSTQRLRGCLSLVMIGVFLIFGVWVVHSYLQVAQYLGPHNGPSQSTPDTPWLTTPVTVPSFATPPSGVSAP